MDHYRHRRCRYQQTIRTISAFQRHPPTGEGGWGVRAGVVTIFSVMAKYHIPSFVKLLLFTQHASINRRT